MKLTCLFCSKIISAGKSKKVSASKKPLRRPSSAKSLPLLDERLLLEAADVTSLKAVSTLAQFPGHISLNKISKNMRRAKLIRHVV